MHKSIGCVLSKQENIIKETMAYQIHNTKKTGNHTEQRKRLCEFFDKNFTLDEIMVLKAIMYFGRYCYTGEKSTDYEGNVEDVILAWLDNPGNKKEKDLEIDQIVSKGIQIGNYFETGFEELNKRLQHSI